MKGKVIISSAIVVAGSTALIGSASLFTPAVSAQSGQSLDRSRLVAAPVALQLSDKPFYANRLKSASPQIRSQLTDLSKLSVRNKWTFQIGYTTALDRSLAELTGLKLPDKSQLEAKMQTQNKLAIEAIQLDNKYLNVNRLKLLQLPCLTTSPTCNYERPYSIKG